MSEPGHVYMYRSAHHPDFVRHVIDPKLVLAELPIRCASVVASLMDGLGCGVDDAVACVDSLCSWSAPPQEEGTP